MLIPLFGIVAVFLPCSLTSAYAGAVGFVHGASFPDPLVMVDLTDRGDQPAGTDERLYYLKDALGSVAALANAFGDVVERYVYDPYGLPTVWSPDGQAPLAALPLSYYHDADLDGQIDQTDEAHLLACLDDQSPPWPTEVTCVFVHDRDGDHVVTVSDSGEFFGFGERGTVTHFCDRKLVTVPGCPVVPVVVRIDTDTGEIMGEYRSAPAGRELDPSRTTVDLFGNVWAGNRDEKDLIGNARAGSVVKIGLVIGGTRNGQYLDPPFDYCTCVDRDGDGRIRTSPGLGAENTLPWPDVTDGQGGCGTTARVVRILL